MIVVAVIASLFIILSAPYTQVVVDALMGAWPHEFRYIAALATAIPLALALLVAFRRIRDRRALRYTLLAASFGIGGAVVVLGDVAAAEAFHFVEYGVLAMLLHRACARFDDGASLLVPLAACITVGVLDEWFQWFIPIRTGEVRDVLLNVVTSSCGLLLATALDPPRRFALTLGPRSRAVTAAAATGCAVIFGLFAWTLHAGHQIEDGEIGAFASRYSQDELLSASRDRAEQWRSDPPIVLRRLSREDQYLAEGLTHVRARNAAWSSGDMPVAWRENRILERFYEPVLDTRTYASKLGNRWPDVQRAEAAARAVGVSLIIHNARIYTSNPGQPTAAAVAISGSRIARVGGNDEVLALRGRQTRVIDAEGAAVVPGLHDAHGHFAGLGASLSNLDLRATTSYEQVVERVRQRTASAPPGEWVTGRGWDQNDWARKDWPTHDVLSAASPNNPVVLTRIDGHAILANRMALDAGRVTNVTSDPDGGRILRTSAGEPSGVLIDRAQALVNDRIPPVSPSQLEAQILRADQEARRLGLTTVGDPGQTADVIAAYRRLIDAGRLKTRLYVMVSGGSMIAVKPFFDRGPETDYAEHRMAVRAIKLYADGALGSRGAAMLEPYADEPGTRGLLLTPPEEVYAETLAASKAGFQTAIHAIGDRANRLVLDTFARVQKEVPAARDLRMRVEHAQILDAADIPRFAALGIIASMQPTHATSDMPWAPQRIGASRIAEGAYAWQSLLTSGALIASGSDFPVEQPNPLLGFYAAITRQDAAGAPKDGWTPSQRMTREQALRSFTLDAAYAAHAETFSGSLMPGKLADLVMLSSDIMQVPARDILTTTVRLTVVGGEVVYNP